MKNQIKKAQSAASSAAPSGKSEEPVSPENPSVAEELDSLGEILQNVLERYRKLMPDPGFSEADRRRLLGSGVRRYGFIDKVHDVSESNPEFVPPFMNEDELEACLRDIETTRNITVTLGQIDRLNSDMFLTVSDNAFRIALMYYHSVGDAARRRVPGAAAIFQALSLFFKRRSKTSDQPTEMDIKHDVNALLHGKKEGKIVIENKLPSTVKGKRTIIDETEKKKTKFKETDEEAES